MSSRLPFFLVLSLLLGGSSLLETVQAQVGPGFRRPKLFDTLRTQEMRQQYRPNAHVTRGPSGSRTFQSGTSIPFEYRTRRGYVTRIEIRSGLKVIKTIHLSPSSSGRGRFTLSASDFARAGKSGPKLKFKLWAWQGQPGRQSIHGESIGYTLVP
ncbi:MAG: hypothetical protein AAF491_02250 [Verrucomicrobiota bacterium]